MAIIAIAITLCQDDDVDDDGMVCRTHRAQRGEISGAKTEPAVPYNTHVPLCESVPVSGFHPHIIPSIIDLYSWPPQLMATMMVLYCMVDLLYIHG